MRVLCHAQHFKGIGHFVRMHAIARGMSEAHEVYLVDGGRPVPRRPGPRPIELIPLPRLVRASGRIVGLGTDAPVASLVEERIRRLTQAVERIRPDAILVDIYPFQEEAMARPPVEHALDLDGVAATQRIPEELVAGAGPSSPR